MQSAGVRPGNVLRVFALASVLLEAMIVLVVRQQGREVEDRAAFRKALVELERVLADADQRLEPLVDLVLKLKRNAST